MGRLTESREIELLEKAQLKRDVWLLRVEKSWTYAQIAMQYNIGTTTVVSYVKEVSAMLMPEDELEEARNMGSYRIDTDEATATQMIEKLAKMADELQSNGKDVMHIVVEIRRWQERKAELRKERALLLGLNKPVKVEHMHRIKTEFDQEIEDLVASLSGGGLIQTTPEDIWED